MIVNKFELTQALYTYLRRFPNRTIRLISGETVRYDGRDVLVNHLPSHWLTSVDNQYAIASRLGSSDITGLLSWSQRWAMMRRYA